MEAATAAIADPTRRKVLELVRDRELAAGEIAAQFEISRPAVSRHLRVLRGAGLVTERRDGRLRLYRADPAPLALERQPRRRRRRVQAAALKTLAEEER